jgi:hypothetical protein
MPPTHKVAVRYDLCSYLAAVSLEVRSSPFEGTRSLVATLGVATWGPKSCQNNHHLGWDG